jgi:predicted metal-dependent hydrolase
MFLCYNNIMIKPDSIIRSRRRSIALMVNNQGELVVRAPYFVSEVDIMGFVAQKQEWLKKQKALVKQELHDFQPLTLEDNTSLAILGKTYYIARRGVNNILPFGDALLVPFSFDKAALINYLKSLLAPLLKDRVAYYSGLLGVKPTGIKISSATSKWGSCNYKNVLAFVWHLAFCPPDVIDYVVVHELCHIKNKSHDRAFWHQVELILPHYREQEKWLKTHRKVMEII